MVAALLEGDRKTQEAADKKTRAGRPRQINGLAFLGVLASSRASAFAAWDRAKVGLAFDAFDLEDTNDLSRDEFTIALLVVFARADGIAGRGGRRDSDCEQIGTRRIWLGLPGRRSRSTSRDFVAASVDALRAKVVLGFGVSGISSTPRHLSRRRVHVCVALSCLRGVATVHFPRRAE